MKLHHRVMGDGRPLFILHGLFGSSDNWQTLGKRFAEHYKVYLIDQRNHGRSPHSEEFSYELLAEDINELIADSGEEKVNIIGHSMGGKTAIAFTADYPEKVDKLIIGDISHKEYEHHHDQIIEGLKSLDLNSIKSRGKADKELAKYIDEWGVRQFLLKNLYWVEKGQLGWRINIPVLSREIDKIIEEIQFYQIEVETLFIRGGKSDYITKDDYDEIAFKFPNSRIETLEGVGHWIHAEAPDEFYKLVVDFVR